jgi:hypothetical protein
MGCKWCKYERDKDQRYEETVGLLNEQLHAITDTNRVCIIEGNTGRLFMDCNQQQLEQEEEDEFGSLVVSFSNVIRPWISGLQVRQVQEIHVESRQGTSVSLFYLANDKVLAVVGNNNNESVYKVLGKIKSLVEILYVIEMEQEQ